MLLNQIYLAALQSVIFTIQSPTRIDQLIDTLLKLCQVFAVHVQLACGNLISI